MTDLLMYLKEEYEKALAAEVVDDELVAIAARKLLRENALAMFRNPSIRLREVWLTPNESSAVRGRNISVEALALYFRTSKMASGFLVTEVPKNNFGQDQAGVSWTEYYLAVKK